MIKVNFDPSSLTGEDARWWKGWTRRATKATDHAISTYARGARPAFLGKIWSDLKVWLLRKIFHGKCGYCEALIVVTDVGSADHYRPKSQVTTWEGEIVKIVEVEGRLHPGYYWLAYNWKNLIPACGRCNTFGKATHFPVEKSHIAKYEPERCEPDVLDGLEEPLLLNPYCDQPSNFIRFGAKGTVASVDGNLRGKVTIKTLQLDRGDLVAARQKSQEYAWLRYCAAMTLRNFDEARIITENYSSGREPFSAAALEYITVDWNIMSKSAGENICD